eukprot:GHVS01057270.1.p1 GENE.GHVS01057270.1~~GHVS01057270.1.p1  ORF type:complete len:356 (+),score=60.08 GHVS01057270.1:74-1141(+)
MSPSATMEAHQLAVLGMGNPLLDILVDVSTEFLSKFDLKLGNAILAESQHMGVYEEITDKNPALVPGGATQNSIRVCQALLGSKGKTAFSGSIGKDNYGKSMKELLANEGVLGLYQEAESTGTGVCAVLVNGGERSLVTRLGAANEYQLDHLRFKVWEHVENASLLYSSGYFLTVCPQAMMVVGEHAAKTGKVFMVNLAAPFICEFFKDPLMQALPFADYVFGNESEFLQFSKTQGYGTEDLDEVARRIVRLPKVNSRRGRVVVVTQGSEPTIVATDWMGHGAKVQHFPVEPLEKSKLVDTNGAGDAFVGGFLYGLSKGKDIDFCVFAGSYAARHVIQRSGCTFEFKNMPQEMLL